METSCGELAEKWSWQDNYRNLVFFLRKGVKWHDGQPFTSKDVKYTFDMLREAPDAAGKLRINPRKDWYANVEAIEAPDPHTVIFHLKRPQPSLLLMLASGYTPVYAAHVPPGQLPHGCVGTGPFKLKEWRKGEFVEYVKNPDYFVKGRPYLDGLKYIIIAERGTRTAALQAGPARRGVPRRDDARRPPSSSRRPCPSSWSRRRSQNVNDNMHHEHQEAALRQPEGPAGGQPRHRPRARSCRPSTRAAPSSARRSRPKPYGVWGLLEKDLAALPGYGKPADEKAKARKLLAEVGVTAPTSR